MTATLRDAVYGAAVGDALGVPYEFNGRDAFEYTDMVGHGTYHLPAGTYSDDTAMMLATCDSIRALGGRIDCDDIRERFRDWAFRGAYAVDGNVFDIGGTTSAALYGGSGCTDEQSNGNGSLMRIAPLAFTDASDDDIRAVSAITHAHSKSTEACVAYIDVARKLIAGASIAEATQDVRVDAADYVFDPDKPRAEVVSSGYVMATIDAALWCLVNTDSYCECVLAAVNLGHDTDTTACVAGALAGIVYGYDAIPAEWLKKLRGKDIIESCLF